MKVQPRWYLEEGVQALFDFYSTPRMFCDDGIPEDKNALICYPTGTGKSVHQAKFFERAFQMHPSTRAMSLTHVKSLIEQNEKRMRQVWPVAPTGIYSAGLKQRDTAQPLIFGGVQSVANKVELFGYRDFLFIDEAHLVGDEGKYLLTIHRLKWGHHVEFGKRPTVEQYLAAVEDPRCNPFLKIVGLSATPYRVGMGLLTNGPIFTHIVYDICNIEGFDRLLADGYISPLISKETNTQLDVSGVVLGSNGDFAANQLQAAVDKPDTTYAALCEFVTYANRPDDYRHCGMLFASGAEHADHIGEMLNNVFGIPTAVMHSKKTTAENDAAMLAFKTGKARFIVSMNMLTTGVDHPPIDIIGMFRPTMSTGLWVQMLGRGTRPYDYRNPGDVDPIAFPYIKRNCLVLDFANNAVRLGPINDPVIPKRKGEGPPGDAPIRICKAGDPHCNTQCHSSAKFCHVCGHEFTFQEKLSKAASTAEVMKVTLPDIQMIEVDRMVLTPFMSNKGLSAIRVTYYCGRKAYHEQKSVESPAHFFRHKSRQWFRQFYNYNRPVHEVASVDDKDGQPDDVPNNNAHVIRLHHELRTPKRIQVWVNAKPYPEVQGYEF